MEKRIYSFIRRLLTARGKGNFTQCLYTLGIKPTIQKRNSPLDKAIIVFSADFEMAWAFRFSKKNALNAQKKGLEERNNMPILIRLFEKYKIPCTWATVGHLMLDSCYRKNGLAHPEMLRPNFFENKNWLFNEGDWYDHDPATNYLKDPAWYAPDLVDLILESSVEHEIACHTFSHIDFSYENCTPEVANSELNACKVLAAQKNISLTSMVFPGGTMGNFEHLVQKGFTSYRKPMQYDIDLPYIDKFGLVAIPSSYGLDGKPESFSAEKYLTFALSYVKLAIKYKKVCHFWFHPSMNPWYMNNVLTRLLELVADYQDKDKLRILTMHQITKEVLFND